MSQDRPFRNIGSIGRIKGVLSRPRGAVVALQRAVEHTRKLSGRAAGPRSRRAGGGWGGESGANRPERCRALLAPARRAQGRAEAAARRCPRCCRGGSWSERQRRAPQRLSRAPQPRGEVDGGARQGGPCAWAAEPEPEEPPVRRRRCARIVSITSRFSMQAMTRSLPPQAVQRSMSMPKTRRRRCAQPIALRRLGSVCSACI